MAAMTALSDRVNWETSLLKYLWDAACTPKMCIRDSSTILHAEQIIVLDEGQIAGIGTHEELLKNCEAYYQIASSQLSQTELEQAVSRSRKGEAAHE